ncbi:MAG: alpha/beta fold hydrolase [Methanobrevibacter sp.]|uniref:alpha/beta fold hydrolase n=1 Tax=Methanobrevibacter sp. TaxID=66852 RepID=UPI0025CDFA90|nr:alpha/beta fold hydrolase [Methanobrevibacter sp.]MBR0271045.1 alpha/beta fold hydrolase [Methanobrevibacter sp.]
MDSFEFTNGEVLKTVNVEFMTFGTPKYDGNLITNAIVYCHGSLGNFTSVKKIFPLIHENAPFDENKYFFISISALGSPGSCSPSSTGLKNKFPSYTIEDVVNFQKQFLAEKFNINHVLGIIGNSMGGFVALTSAILYPDFADFIMPGVSSYKVAGHDYILSKFVNEIITSDENYENGISNDSIKRTIRLASLAEFNFGVSKEALRATPKDELSQNFEEYGEESLFLDVYDIKYCNEACMNYDVENDLDKIKSKTFIISCAQDPHFPPELDGIPMSEMIKGSQIVIMDSQLGHLCFNELETIADELNEFMKNFGE